MNSNRNHLQEIVEIVGVISIVASLLLVAWEVRQSNRIAAAEIEMQLAQGFNQINIARASAPDVAKLFPKLSAPESHLITATEDSQTIGLARHMVNVYWSAQIAYENGLLSEESLESYRSDVAQAIETYPGLHRHLIAIYTAYPEMQKSRVFQPIGELAARQREETDDSQ